MSTLKSALNPVAQKWVEALRSGKYKQAKGQLAIHDEKGAVKYCCLGVLCELAVAEGIVKKKEKGKSHVIVYGQRDDLLPVKVQKWAGLKTNNGKVSQELQGRSLAVLNDEGISFKKIARLIEQRAKELFIE